MSQLLVKHADLIDLQEKNETLISQASMIQTQSVSPDATSLAISQEEVLYGLAVQAVEEDIINQQPEVQQSLQIAQNEHQYTTHEINNIQSTIQDKNLSDAQVEDCSGEDQDTVNTRSEDGMKYELIDKISSSPSIEDGGYILAPLWPQRSTSCACVTNGDPSSSQACDESSFSITESPDKFSLRIFSDPCDKDACQSCNRQKEYVPISGDPLESFQQRCPDEHHFQVPGAFIESPDTPDQKFPLHSPTEVFCDENNSVLLNEISSTHVNSHTKFHPLIESHNFSNENQKIESPEPRFSIVVPHSLDELLTFPDESSEDEYDVDDETGISYDADSRFVDSGWGGESLQELEDIDFEFVYALHTFVATVEGQANATKGDTMVLLDESNSYWWLVRVVKDSSIGYLPAEYIETPTERLARLNKHRNIDFTSSMLGDLTERPKISVKSAFRKKNIKTVTFSEPTYVEASDIDYSTEEEIDGRGEKLQYQSQVSNQDLTFDHQEDMDEEDEIEGIEPLRTRAEVRNVGSPGEQDSSLLGNEVSYMRTNEDNLNGKPENKSRNGVLRNTDSFFQDDTVETRKITLTPNLLRNDSTPSTVRSSNDSKELTRSSLDKLEKDSPDRSKDKKDRKEKKDKDKKTGMLSGLFKRKDKKNKSVDEDIEEILGIKQSNETSRNSPALSKESDDIIQSDEQSPVLSSGQQKQLSQTKSQIRTSSPAKKTIAQTGEPRNLNTGSIAITSDAGSVNDASSKLLRLVTSEDSIEDIKKQKKSPSQSLNPSTSAASNVENISSKGFVSENVGDSSSVTASEKNLPIDSENQSSSANVSSDISRTRSGMVSQQHALDNSDVLEIPSADRSNCVEERLSESPVQVTSTEDSQFSPPALVVDNSSQDGPLSSTPSISPEPIYEEDTLTKTASRNSTIAESTTRWNDVYLKTFFDDSAEIKDLLTVVYDKSGVEPAGPEHPLVRNLFKEENIKLAEMKNRLDCLLGDWLARKLRNSSEF